MKIIINADDFGFSKSINEGIVEAFKDGLISSTTIMINMPYAEDAIYKWKENTSLGLGLHINLTQGSPISSDVKSLVDDTNTFYNHKMIENGEVEILYEDAYKEIKAQIEKLLSYDVVVDHLDYHHFIYSNLSIRKALINLACEYNLPIRAMDKEFRDEIRGVGLKTTDEFSFDFYGDQLSWRNIIDFINKHNNSNSIEILTHCGYIDEDTRNRTSYLLREKELNELKKLKSHDFYKKYSLSKYGDL